MCWRAAHRARRACYDAGKRRGKWVTAREAGGRSQRSGGAAAGAKRPEMPGRAATGRPPRHFVWQARGPKAPGPTKRRRPPRSAGIFAGAKEPWKPGINGEGRLAPRLKRGPPLIFLLEKGKSPGFKPKPNIKYRRQRKLATANNRRVHMTKGKRYLFFILLGVALLAGSLLLYLGFTQQRSAPSGGSKFVWREGEERDAR